MQSAGQVASSSTADGGDGKCANDEPRVNGMSHVFTVFHRENARDGLFDRQCSQADSVTENAKEPQWRVMVIGEIVV